MPEYIIQRYSVTNHDAIRGLVPFLATGPAFLGHVRPRSLGLFGEHRMSSAFLSTIRTVLGGLGGDWRDVAAEWLLREGVVQALWSVDGGSCLLPELRWEASVLGLVRELPRDGEVVEAVIDLLAGLSGPEHHRSYLSEDGLVLEPCPVP